MIRSKLGLFSLCVVVFGVTALAASGARAETGARWLILDPSGQVLDAGNLLASINITELENNTASLLTKVLGIPFEILCTSASLEGDHLEGNGSLTNGGRVVFHGCIVKLNGVLNNKCKPKSGGAPIGLILTNSLKGLIVLHQLVGGAMDDLIRLEPSIGETWATLNMGPECPVGELIPIRGKLFLKDGQNAFLTHQVTHLFLEGPLTHLWVLNLTPEHKATVDGSAIVALTGAHAGLSWSGDPA